MHVWRNIIDPVERDRFIRDRGLGNPFPDARISVCTACSCVRIERSIRAGFVGGAMGYKISDIGWNIPQTGTRLSGTIT